MNVSTVFNTLACEQNDTRLVGGQNKFEGFVEVCDSGEWKTVCNGNHTQRTAEWDDREAKVICRQIGFSEDRRGLPVCCKPDRQDIHQN